MCIFFTSNFVFAHQEMFLKPGREKHTGPPVRALHSHITLLCTHCVPLATGGALWALVFLSRNEEVTGEDSLSFIPLWNISDYPEHIKYYLGSSELTFLSPQHSGLAGLRTELLDVAVLDIPPSAQLDIEGSQSHKKSSWHFTGR